MKISDLYARLRNLFNVGVFKKRDKETVTVQTEFGRTLEAVEVFPYGFIAKAKEGKALILSQGGNAGSFLLLPICSAEGAPELQEGDSALWSKDGGFVIARSDKTVELNGTEHGGLIKIAELKKELEKTNAFLKAFVQVLQVPVTEAGNGAPSVFQAALNGALSSLQLADFSQIENTKVQHGGS